MWIEATVAFAADAAQLAHEEDAAEEVRPDFHAIETPFVPLGADADEGGCLRRSFRSGRMRTREAASAKSGSWMGYGEGVLRGLGMMTRKV